LWKLDATANVDPCQAAAQQQWQCYRTGDLTIPLLRQQDRPGILLLQKGEEPAVYAVLTGLNDQTATLLLNGQRHPVPLITLARYWRGDFATYWQPPRGYSPDVRDGVASVALGQLSRQLAVLEGKPVAAGAAEAVVLDPALSARVKAFQKGQGLKPDGHPGPLTFMQLDKASGVNGPSLQSGSR
jgi:general secretion pathway protein A